MICSKSECLGCFSCYNKCPKNAIVMVEDDNGFIYPEIDKNKCINCGLCKKVCPALNGSKLQKNKPTKCYSYQLPNKKELLKSSSGGIATMIANYILENNGVVYGASFSKGSKIQHIRVDNKNDLDKLKGSKYVHSYIMNSYSDVLKDLKDNKFVAFFGTPCQIAGLKMFLSKDFSNLVCIDLVCHGVPSQRYLKDEIGSDVTSISFRDNNKYILTAYDNEQKVILRKNVYESEYLSGFTDGFFCRENCYKCNYAQNKRVSDITIGDFWGLSEKSIFYNNRNSGVSEVLINTSAGKEFIDKIRNNDTLSFEERSVKEALEGNAQLNKPTLKSKNTDLFKQLYPKYGFKKSYFLARKFEKQYWKNKFKCSKILRTIYNNKKLVLAWLLLVLWMIFIFYMSSCNGNVSSGQSGTIAYVLHNILSINYSDKLIFIIRKCAHVSEFFILGILVINLVSKYNVKHIYFISFIICVLYASSDEFHQLFVPGRSGQVTDVLIDLIGVVLGLLLVFLIRCFRKE